MKVILTKSLSIGWILLAIMTIALAIVISTARITLPMISDYRSNIEHQVSGILQRPVTIGEIGVSWDRLRPVLQLYDITIRDQEDTRDSFHFEKLQLSFQMLRSIRQLKLLPHSIYLSGSALAITRTPDGEFVFRGLSGLKPTGNITVGERLASFKNLAITLRDVKLIWHDQPLQQNWEFNVEELRSWIWEGGLSLEGRLHLPKQLGESIDVTAVIRGDLDDYRLWEGDYYLRTDNARVSMFPTLWRDDWPRVEEGFAATETWGSWKGLDRMEAIGSMSIVDLRLVSAKNRGTESDVLMLPQWSGNYRWSSQGKSWHLDVANLEVVTDDRHWPGDGFSLDFKRRGNQSGQLRGDLDFLDLDTVGDLVTSLPILPPDTRSLVDTLKLSGEVSNLRFSTDTHTKEPKYLVNAEVAELGWREAKKLPGVSGLNISLSANEEGGIAELHAPGGSFEYSRLFENYLAWKDFSTELNWRKTDTGWTLQSDNIRLVNDDLSGFGTAKLDFFAAEKKPEMYLEMVVPRLDVGKVPEYLPYGIIPDKTAYWLRHAFVSGHGVNGRVSYAGELKRHALKYEDVEFKADVSVRDVELHYRDEWPNAKKLAAEVSFRNAGFSANVASGRIRGADITGGKLGIENFYLSRFLMDASARGDAPQYIDFLQNSPLSRGGLHDFLDTVESEGKVDLGLKLDIPLSRKISDPLSVRGKVGLNKANLSIPAQDVSFSAVTGDLDFTEEEFRAEDIKAIFREAPVTATIATGRQREIFIDVEGEFSLGQLLPDHDAAWMSLGPGQSNWNARVTIPRSKDGQQPMLDIMSELEGIAIQLPGNLGKTVADKRPFKLSWELGPSIPAVDIHYDDLVRIRALVKKEQGHLKIDRADVAVGGQAANLSGEAVGIRGALPELVLEEWITVIEHLAKGGEGESLDLREIDLQVDRLKAFGQIFPDVHVMMARHEQNWNIALLAADIAGDIVLPDDWKSGKPLEARLNRLVVKRNHATAENTGQERKIIRPEVMPAIHANISNLVWGDAEFDRAEINAVRSGEEWLIQKAWFESKIMTLSAAGGWLGNDGGTPSSRFQFQMDSSDVGAAMKQLEFSSGLGDGKGSIKGDVTWVGTPFEPHFPSLNGQVSVNINKGRLKEVEPGLGRLLSLVNLDNLPKRLVLNFKDVALEGLQYDSLSGAGRFEDGTLVIDGLGIDSTGAAISLYGKTSLPQRNYDLHLNVVPKFKSAVPIAAGVFIAPQTGFLVYFLDKLVEAMGVDINESALLEYRITGDWESPNVERSSATVEEVRENPFLFEE